MFLLFRLVLVYIFVSKKLGFFVVVVVVFVVLCYICFLSCCTGIAKTEK